MIDKLTLQSELNYRPFRHKLQLKNHTRSSKRFLPSQQLINKGRKRLSAVITNSSSTMKQILCRQDKHTQTSLQNINESDKMVTSMETMVPTVAQLAQDNEYEKQEEEVHQTKIQNIVPTVAQLIQEHSQNDEEQQQYEQKIVDAMMTKSPKQQQQQPQFLLDQKKENEGSGYVEECKLAVQPVQSEVYIQIQTPQKSESTMDVIPEDKELSENSEYPEDGKSISNASSKNRQKIKYVIPERSPKENKFLKRFRAQ